MGGGGLRRLGAFGVVTRLATVAATSLPRRVSWAGAIVCRPSALPDTMNRRQATNPPLHAKTRCVGVAGVEGGSRTILVSQVERAPMLPASQRKSSMASLKCQLSQTRSLACLICSCSHKRHSAPPGISMIMLRNSPSRRWSSRFGNVC